MPAGWGARASAGRVALFGLAVGVPLNFFYALPVGDGEAWYYLKFTAWLAGAPIMALGWMGLAAMLHERFGLASGRLAAVGRMALTNYLAQSVIMTTVFYWFGLYASASVGFAVMLMAGAWLAQVIWSKAWISRFGHGPVEWLWRRLSYGKAPH